MVHLAALPGAPRWAGSMDAVIERAIDDTRALEAAGFDGLIIENFGDAPFHRVRVPAVTISTMTRVAGEVRRVTGLPLGINVLRNDARAALAIAAATGAAFIRVNGHTSAMITDQVWMDGEAWKTLRLRRDLGLTCAVLADVDVKHAVLPPGVSLAAVARDTWHRGLADALIVTGPETGAPPEPDRLDTVREAVPDAPVWLGSGVRAESAAHLAARADGVIVGSAAKVGGDSANPVDPGRAASIIAAIRSIARTD